MTLLEKLADPNLLEKLTTGEKVNAALQTTVLGMGITFGALVIIWGLCIVLSKVVESIQSGDKDEVKVIKKQKEVNIEEVDDSEDLSDDELVAVISAAIASSLNTSTENIFVRNIVRVNDNVPTWGRVARIDQVNSKL